MTLELIPNGDLVFKGPFNAVSTTTLKLSNSGNERLAYKIKTTAPKRYCVKPNSGFLDGRGTANIQVMLQPQTPGQPDDRTRHKFMVQWAEVPNNYSDDVDNFWKQDLKNFNVQDSKLKCVFADEQQTATASNESQGQRRLDQPTTRSNESSNLNENLLQTSTQIFTQRSNPNESIQIQKTERSQGIDDKSLLKKEIQRLKEDNDQLKEKIREQETGLRHRISDTISTSGRNKSNQQGNGLVFYGFALSEQIVLVAFIIALLFGLSFGYFLFSCSN